MAKRPYQPSPAFVLICGGFLALSVIFFTLPHIALLAFESPVVLPPFHVSVDPINKTITASDAPIVSRGTLMFASALQGLGDGTELLASAIMSTKVYSAVLTESAPVALTITPGMRREQVANILQRSMGWTSDQKQIFLNVASSTAGTEGHLYPSTYILHASTTPAEAYRAIEDRFEARVLARYGSTTEEVVPLSDALTIASIIEREAGTTDEMRVISGILWNRLFAGMRLQADSTLQYARGTQQNGWWPVPRSRDKYIQSAYNTYLNAGLPPSPIASPSIPAIMAALNPEKTDCIFFFHSKGEFYCSETYEEHVAALKKIYGRGR